MKKFGSAILALCLLTMGLAGMAENTGEVEHRPVAPVNRLGFEVLRMLSDGTENQMVAPMSLACALAMAAQGAAGETRGELLDALGVQSEGEVAALMETLKKAELKVANAAFLAEGFEAEEDYVAALREQFDAEWFEGNGGLVQAINAWTKEHTGGLIERLFDDEPEDWKGLVLLNAAALDAQWEFVFRTVEEGMFCAPDGDMPASFMRGEFSADYGEREDAQLLRLRYRDSDMALMIALPKEGGVAAVLDGLCEEQLAYFQFEAGQRRIRLSMPRADISTDNDLKEALQALGVRRAFTDRADFSGISSEKTLFIDSVRQKARLIFDEEGTRAAAVTEVEIAPASAREPEAVVEFQMNRPFAIVIADEDSGVVCFAGVVEKPSGD